MQSNSSGTLLVVALLLGITLVIAIAVIAATGKIHILFNLCR